MSLSLNKALIIGNVTRDPEARTTPNGQTVASFGVATNRRWKDASTGDWKDQAEFHNIVAWGRLAETCKQYLKKGSKVYIEGRMQTRTWDDQTGAKKNRTEVVADQMIMLDRAGASTGTGPSTPSEAEQEQLPPTAPAEEEINVEDIPF